MARARSEEGRRAGQLIAELRARHHLTQEAAAQLLKVGHRTYQAWEAGDSVPRWHNRVKLGKLYGVDPAEILGPAAPAMEAQLVARLSARVGELESELSHQGRVLDALREAMETQLAVRVARSAREAQQQARGTPRRAGRRPQA